MATEAEPCTARIAGRVSGVRSMGAKLHFLDLWDVTGAGVASIQVVVRGPLPAAIAKGDVLGVEGRPGTTANGTLSVFPSEEVTVLAKPAQALPDALEDPERRARHRVLDLLVNRRGLGPLLKRSAVVRALRATLDRQGFVEVDTPVLWPGAGGAVAKAFATESDARGALQLRIAPELFLKQLVVAGLHKVFEIARVFRNEGLDATHNVEFTMAEVYWALADYQDLVRFTEETLRHIEAEANGQCVLFAADFDRVDIVPALERELRARGLGDWVPADWNDEAEAPRLADACARLGLELGRGPTLARCVSKLIGELLEAQCTRPTFLLNHPVCVSPLAKAHRSVPGVVERFEVFVAGVELCNAYSELNDPEEQRERFAMGEGTLGENERRYVDALRLGLVPTAGWGLGIERLAMVLSQASHIREVVCFPLLNK